MFLLLNRLLVNPKYNKETSPSSSLSSSSSSSCAVNRDFPDCTLTLDSSLSPIAFDRSYSLHPTSVETCCKYVLIGHPTPACQCEGAHKRKSHMSSSLLFQQCLAYLVRLIWMVLQIGGRWPYSCYFVGCCQQDLFNMARIIVVHLSSSLFSIRFVSVDMVHPYSSMDTTAAWKKLCFILSEWFDFHMTNSIYIAEHAFASNELMSFLVDETLLMR